MLKQCDMNDYALPFAAWDLRLYLDTHPCDERAFEAYKQLCAAAGDKCNYACNPGITRASYGECDCEVNGTDWRDVSNVVGSSCGCDGISNRRGNNGSCGCDGIGNRRGNNSLCGCDGLAGRLENDGACVCDSDERVWHWVDGPWPWEFAANIIGGDC